MAMPPIDQAALERQRALQAERERHIAAEQAARSSAVLVQLGRSGSSAGRAPGEAAEAVSGPGPGENAGSAAGPSGPAASAAGAGGTSLARLSPPAAPWTLSAGTTIPASLITGLSSDLPGLVLAQVTQAVRDSATGRAVLIPQGARLIGRYDNVVAFGQRRALLVWQRIVLPDGSSLDLDNMPATDLAGFAGLEDRVDFHTWRLLKGIALSTLLGVGTELSLGSGESDLVRAIRESAQQNGARAGDQITQRNLDVQPTLRVRPGWPVRAIVHKDLVLRPWRG
jgi:type IV secretion system protein VirB10